MNTIQNPILPGFAPDASALHVGKDYYIATSTFEWWPGIEIYHSQDLVNWEWAAAPIARRDMVPSELLGNYKFRQPVGAASLLRGRAVLAGLYRCQKLDCL